MKKDLYREYTNGIITVEWRKELCDHSAVCINELPEVFNMLRIPWVDINGASTEEIMRVVDACPTHALAWRYNDPAKNEERDNARKEAPEEAPVDEKQGGAKVVLVKDGPIVIKGKLTIREEDGTITEKTGAISLCRCGKSQKMPWCDGAHLE